MKKIKLLSLLLCLVLTVGTMTSCLLLGDNGMTLEDVETLLNQRLDGNITVEGGDSYNVEINTSLPSEQLAAGKALFCIVPAPTKAQAVKRTLEREINEDCPATILRRHSSAVLYLDGDSSALL